MTPPALIGRDAEMRVLAGLVDRAKEQGAALVLRGHAGIGKSVLLEAAKERARARGMLVLSATGTKMESHLPFAALHQLLRPILAGTTELPTRQRDALLAAFGMTEVPSPELFLVALAALDLLTDAAPNAPLFLAVDDAHWLDRASAEVLAFVARRLESDPIVMMFGLRDGGASTFDEAGLVELPLGGLDTGPAGALLDAHAPDLAPALRQRILEEAEGNPLALVELPAALQAEQLSGADLIPARLPLTDRLERAFAARGAELPAATRTVLVVGAANDGGAVADVLRGASIVDGEERTIEDFAPAISVGLLDIRAMELKCRHPLVRSAIYQAATEPERQAAHRALGEVFAGQPDRRVWHLAAASLAPDEFVARELEEAAARAQQRGGTMTAVSALERAAQLTPDAAGRASRLLRAAELAFELGRRETVLRLLDQAEPLTLGLAERTQKTWLREIFDDGIPGSASGVHTLVDVADSVAEGDPDLALKLLGGAGLRCWWASLDEDVRRRVVTVAERLPVDPDDPRLLAVLGWAEPARRGAVVLAGLRRVARHGGGDPGAARLYGLAASAVGDHELAARFLSDAVAGLRVHGRVGLLAQALVLRSWSGLHGGNLKLAMADAEEGRRLAAETSQPFWATRGRVGESVLAGMRGDVVGAAALAAEAEAAALPTGASAVLSDVQMARGLTALGCGQADDAYAQLRRMFDPSDPAHHYMKSGWAIGDLAEAAVHSGQVAEARSLLKGLERAEADSPSPRLRLAMQYARALLADGHHAEVQFQTALSVDLTAWPFARARLLLAYGEWLRRQRRTADSRPLLRAARDACDALGVTAWGERARQELRAAGERSDGRAPGGWDRLTSQELQIAEMAADGLSNREIGQRLYLSHRTVGSHLYRIFPKLGITSRQELRAALDGISSLA